MGMMTKEHIVQPALRARVRLVLFWPEQEAGSSGDFPSWLAYPVPMGSEAPAWGPSASGGRPRQLSPEGRFPSATRCAMGAAQVGGR